MEQLLDGDAPLRPPLAVVVVEAAKGEPRFLGYHYAEELSCGDLGPALSR